MSSEAMSLKARIRNMAREQKIPAQVLLQNYMFERFLERLSRSPYRDKFVVKGGMLIAAIVGLSTRSTMDLDATIRNYPLSEEHIEPAIDEICNVHIDDNVVFRTFGVEPIRKDDEYGGLRISLEATYDSIITPLSIDITSGDVITPAAVRYSFRKMFDEHQRIELWAYNIETVLAEKVETVLRRGVFNTRPRDFYDIYILAKTQSFNTAVFQRALRVTAEHRKTTSQIQGIASIMDSIKNSDSLKANWKKYQREYLYARDITYEDAFAELARLLLDMSM